MKIPTQIDKAIEKAVELLCKFNLSTFLYKKIRESTVKNQKKWIAEWYPNSHSTKKTRKDIAKHFDCCVPQVDKMIKQCKDEGLI